MYEEIERIEREAYRKGMKLYGIYLKLKPKYRYAADKVLNGIAQGRVTYEEALKKLRELYRKQQLEREKRIKDRARKH